MQDNPLIKQQLQHCDMEHYLCGLFSPQPHREALWIVYAFGCELAKISHIVQEPMLGRMRLQWWQDAIEAAVSSEGLKSGNVLADRLTSIICSKNLPPELFYAIIEARRLDFDNSFLNSAQAFERYHDDIWGNLYRLVTLIMMTDESKSSAEIALDASIFRMGGQLTGRLKFLLLSPKQDIRAHILLNRCDKAEQTAVQLETEEQDSFKLYKTQQIKQLEREYQDFSKGLTVLPKASHYAFLYLALLPHYIKLLQDEKGLRAEKPLKLGLLKTIYSLWRANHSF